MNAEVEIFETRSGGRRDVPGTSGTPGCRARRWRLSIATATVLLMVMAALLAAGSLLYSQEEDAPMQVEPKVVAS